MDLSRLNPLPEWKPRMTEFEAGEGWKYQESLQAAEALYNKWREVFGMVMAFAENLRQSAVGSPTDFRNLILENAYLIAPKIQSAGGPTLYQIKMENAALIRFNSRQMMEQIIFAVMVGAADESYKNVIQDSMDEFKFLFRQWVATFGPDGEPDDWGLFV